VVNGFESLLAVIEEQPLSRSLPRVLSTAITIGADDLACWTKLELMGYFPENPAMTDEVVVPEYRSVAGAWFDDFGRMFLLENPDLHFVNELRLRHGVAELEGLATATGPLSMRELNNAAVIRETLKVQVTTFEFDPRSISQVLTNIRVHLLDRVSAYRGEIAPLRVTREAVEPEVFKLAPEFYGVSVDLKALWRRLFGRGS
jgi:hypothetical protein